MKKFTIIAYIILILMIFISGFFIYKVIAKNQNNEEKDSKEKALANIEFLEHELVNLFNEINNIKFENYTISATKIEKKENKSESADSLKSDSGDGEKKEKTEEDKQENSKGGTSDSSSESSSQGETADKAQNESSNNQQYKMEKDGVLTNTENTNWKQIKNEIERAYSLLYPVATDLQQIINDKQKIQNFSNEYDNLAKVANEENKEETLKELSLLYNYMPQFFDICEENKNKVTIIKVKDNILKAYSILDNENWNEILNYIEQSQKEFYNLKKQKNKQSELNSYTLEKINNILNDLKHSANIKDRDIFLINYKNALEELEKI